MVSYRRTVCLKRYINSISGFPLFRSLPIPFFEAGEMIRNNKQTSLLRKNCVAVHKTLEVSISDSRFLLIPI